MSRFTSSYEAEAFFKLSLEEKIALRNETTVNELIEEYLEKWAKPNKRSWKSDERYLSKDVQPYWGDLKASDITNRDIVLLLDKIIERGSPVAANRALACIRRMFNFGVERGVLYTSPCISIKSAISEQSRDRVLTENEIKILWSALEHKAYNILHEVYISAQTRLALQLQLVLAQRKGEIISAKWSDVNLDSCWWTIPASKSKNKKTHRVPLTKLALELLEKIKKLSGKSIFLFPSNRTESHINGSAIDHAVRRSSFKGVDQWTPHDLRRSAASYMTSLGIDRLIVSKILNHTENSATSIYDRYSYDKEKIGALELWEKKIINIVYEGK